MRKGFTAIELAVVFIIIAILAVMLMPALERGRVGAMRTKCIANIHQVGIAFSMYRTDNREEWPWARVSVEPGHPRWPDPTGSLALLYPSYAPKAYLFACPETKDVVLFQEDGRDFLNCQNFFVSPEGRAMRPEDEGKRPPRPPSYFYDAGSGAGPGIPRDAAPGRVVYGDQCVHDVWRAGGQRFWVGRDNHRGGGNFLFVDSHVQWLPLDWTGIPYEITRSLPYVANPLSRPLASLPGRPPVEGPLDRNVFVSDWQGRRPHEDADLSGMMWFDGSWKEF